MQKKRRRMRMLAVLALLFFTMMLSGCYDEREIDDLAYPLAIGLDTGTADSLRLTLQLAVPLAIGKGGGEEEGGGKGTSSYMITVDAPSLYTALNLINNTVSKEINTSHAKVVVISRKLAETDLKKYLKGIQRGREFRPDIYVVISNGTAEEYLKNVKPTLENNPSKYFELLLGKESTSFYPNTNMHDFYNAFESDSIEPVAILSDLGRYKSTDAIRNEEQNASTGGKRLEGQYEAGSTPIVSQGKNEVMGMAVFKNGKMTGTMSGAEASCYLMIKGDYRYSYWTIPDKMEKGDIVVMNIMQRKKPDIRIHLEGGRVTARIHLDLEGDFTSIQSNRDYEDFPGIMEQEGSRVIKEETLKFLKRTTDEFDSDVCGIGRYVKGCFRTWDEWKSYNWFDKYKYTEFQVDVNLKMRRSGLMIRSVG